MERELSWESPSLNAADEKDLVHARRGGGVRGEKCPVNISAKKCPHFSFLVNSSIFVSMLS